jgi:hypothetical protein
MKRRQERYQDIVEKLFEEIRSHWDDFPRVNRLLIELGRIYDPLLSGRVVEPSIHRQIMELLRSGKTEEARQVLEQRIESHHRFERLKQEREAAFRSE